MSEEYIPFCLARTTYSRLTLAHLIEKLRHATIKYKTLPEAHQVILLRMLEHDLQYMQWVIASIQQIEEVRKLEIQGVHLRYGLFGGMRPQD